VVSHLDVVEEHRWNYPLPARPVAIDEVLAEAENRCAAMNDIRSGAKEYALRTLLWITFAMPVALFVLAARALVVRGRLESHGVLARATVTSYRQWTDDMTHHDIAYHGQAE